jgi:hypothetical protein
MLQIRAFLPFMPESNFYHSATCHCLLEGCDVFENNHPYISCRQNGVAGIERKSAQWAFEKRLTGFG